MSNEEKNVNQEEVKDEKITEEIKEEKEKKPLIRRILIESDGNNINYNVENVAGKLELIAIVQTVLNDIVTKKQ